MISAIPPDSDSRISHLLHPDAVTIPTLPRHSIVTGWTDPCPRYICVFITSRSEVEHRDTGKQYLLTRTLHVCTLPYLIYDQQQFRHENGMNATSS